MEERTHNKIVSLYSKQILGVDITDATIGEVVEFLTKEIKKKDEKIIVVTPNPEIIVFAKHHDNFMQILNGARVSLCDGMGVLLASRFLGKGLSQRITGVDMMLALCDKAATSGMRIGLLGAKNGIAEKTSICLKQLYPKLDVVLATSEWQEDYNDKEIDILFVAFGFPKQEFWMNENLPKTKITAMMGVGGAFDYISGEVSRAPYIIRAIGLEWLYRLVNQPWRIKRQLALIEFIYLVLKERVS